MPRISDERAILALDPGSRGLAFVAFEGGELIDWGTCGEGRPPGDSLDRLLDRYRSDVLVIEDGNAPGSERRPAVRRLLETLARRAERRGTLVVRVPRRTVRESWVEHGFTRKEAVAEALAESFPELAPIVPPRRKAWQPERPRIDIFDALTLLLHTFRWPIPSNLRHRLGTKASP